MYPNGLHTAIDTSAGAAAAVPEAGRTRRFAFAGYKAADDQLYKKITGHSINNPLEILAARERLGKPVWIRHVLVPGLTLEDVQLRKLGRLLQHYSCIERVELLPFHKMGEYKWEELGEKYTLSDTQPPTPEQVEHARSLLKKYELKVI